jgi:hypothetical protein
VPFLTGRARHAPRLCTQSGGILTPRTLGNVWRYFRLPQQGWGLLLAGSEQKPEHPTTHRAVPTTKMSLAPKTKFSWGCWTFAIKKQFSKWGPLTSNMNIILFFFFFWDRVLFCDHAVLKLVQECAQLKLVFWEIFLSVLPSSLIDSFKLFLIWNLPPTKEILLAGWQADQTTESKHYHVSNVPVR